MKTLILYLALLIPFLLACKSAQQINDEPLQKLAYSNTAVAAQKMAKGKWGQYRSEMIHEDASYSSSQEEEELKFDFFRPQGVKERLPLVVFIHSGAFISGSKRNFVISQYCKDLVRTGAYAGAIIDYRHVGLGNAMMKSLFRAKLMQSVGDAKQAIQYFIDHADRYNIDPSEIYIVGYSAGAIIANQIIYTDFAEAETYISANDVQQTISSMASYVGVDDVFSMDNKAYFDLDLRKHIKGVVSISGAVMSHAMLDDIDNIDTPLLLIHGTKDKVVPIGNATPLVKYVDDDINVYVPNLTPIQLRRGILSKVTFKKDVLSKWLDYLTTPVCGSRCIYDGVYKDSNIKLMEIENAPHLFMLSEEGLMNETYMNTRDAIMRFFNASKN